MLVIKSMHLINLDIANYCNRSQARILLKMYLIAPNFVNPASKLGSLSPLLVTVYSQRWVTDWDGKL